MAKQKALTESERKRIEKEREQTAAELERLREYMRTQPDPIDDEMTLDVYEREKNLAIVRRLEEKLASIDYALRSAKKGRYGICERCGNPIDPARLKVLPETTLCVKCKNEMEKAARRAALG